MKLNEWTKGKGIVMMDRLFKVLSKKTGADKEDIKSMVEKDSHTQVPNQVFQ